MNPLRKFKEKIFIARLHAKDTHAYTEVYNTYMERIYRFIYFKVDTKHDAQDLTSEVFLRTWRYITEKNGKIENLNAFLYQVARNTVSDFFRKMSHTTQAIKDDTDGKTDEIIDTRQQEIFQRIDIGRDIETVENILRSLKGEYREVIILKYIEQMDDGEIAKIMERSKEAVRVLTHRALKKTREQFFTTKP